MSGPFTGGMLRKMSRQGPRSLAVADGGGEAVGSREQQGTPEAQGAPVLEVRGAEKRYGNTQALAGVDLTVHSGEILGLVGHNGAGKSTLVRVLVGLTRPDRGEMVVGGVPVTGRYSLDIAREAGIRIVFQELSLCPTLRVFENAFVSQPSLAGWGWRKRSKRLISEQLDRIFPGHGIRVGRIVAGLSLAQRQMVEIAQATVRQGEPLHLLVLDEPTSALGAEPAQQLFRFLQQLRQTEGTSAIFISHKMREVLGNTDRVVVMSDGRVVGERDSKEASPDEVIALMGAVAAEGREGPTPGRQAPTPRLDRPRGQVVVRADKLSTGPLQNVSLELRAGELVGLAGLDGQGQHELLLEVWRRRRRHRLRAGPVRVRLPVGYVTGDRQVAGVFALWSVGRNVSVGSLDNLSMAGWVRRAKEDDLINRWIRRLEIRGSAGAGILQLSGGNQQKALLGRALASKAQIVLLDDPFRGVDVMTKRQAYSLMREEAARGRSFLWFSTENAELLECDRVYVFHQGTVVDEFEGEEIREERIIASSFAEPENDDEAPEETGTGHHDR